MSGQVSDRGLAASGTTYYVDAESGNDQNDGQGPSKAWRTLARVNAAKLEPGDAVLLKRGQVWNESLVPTSAGADSAPITFAAYGSGAAPVLDGSVSFTSLHWTEEKPHVWSAPLPSDGDRKPERIFIDGRPLADKFLRASATVLRAEKEWTWEPRDGGTLIVYSEEAPITWGTRVEVNVRRHGLQLGTKSYINVKGLQLRRFREGMYIGGNRCEIEDVVSTENSFSGFTISGSTNRLFRVEASRNGIDATAGDTDAHGIGVLIDGYGEARGSDNEVTDLVANDNSEDGIQTGPRAGNGNRFYNARMKGNRENCIDIKAGDQAVIGGELSSDAETSADCILVHKVPHRVLIRDAKVVSTTKGPAVTVLQGATVDIANSDLEADDSSAILLGDEAGDGSKILATKITGGGKRSKSLIEIRAGRGHVIEGNTITTSAGIEAVKIGPAAAAAIRANEIKNGN